MASTASAAMFCKTTGRLTLRVNRFCVSCNARRCVEVEIRLRARPRIRRRARAGAGGTVANPAAFRPQLLKSPLSMVTERLLNPR